MGKLLILGGSACQLHAFQLAKKRNLQTVLFDYLPHPPAAALADTHVQVSTFDFEACLHHARALGVTAVMTLGTDQPVYTAAYIAGALGLPGYLSPGQALAVTNKARMKEIFDRNNIPTVPWQLVDKAVLCGLDFTTPRVIKPLDSQGQKGVFRLETAEEAAALYGQSLSFSRCEQLLCEDYYPHCEITVSAWVHAGQAKLLTVTDRITFAQYRHIGVCAAHRYPSQYAAGLQGETASLTQKITDAFGLSDGPLYIQILAGKRGLMVNEIACRIGGAFEDVFIPLLTGFDILAAVMDAAEGRPVAPPARTAAGGSVRVLLPFARAGRLAALTPPEELLALPFVKSAGYNFSPGDTLPPLENAGARLGHMVLYAENEAQMQKDLALFYRAFYAKGLSGENLLIPHEI